MTVRCLVMLAIGIIPLFFMSVGAQATDQTSQCKWDFPWPRTVYYYIDTTPGHFTSSEATRVSYGPNTWSEGGFNLKFTRVYNKTSATYYRPPRENYYYYTTVQKGFVSNDPLASAAAYVMDSTGAVHYITSTSSCNRDAGRPIRQVTTVFNTNTNFYLDCKSAFSHCNANDLVDIHNTSSHEFGHWFFLGHTGSNYVSDTMYRTSGFGEWTKRDLASHDWTSARAMYGCRAGYGGTYCYAN
ncbi:hypothetical protein BH24CHL1_BH24CHL1_09100 [soil metagenome]